MDSAPSVSLKSPSADEIFKSNSGTALESEGLTWKSSLVGVAYALVLYSVQTLLHWALGTLVVAWVCYVVHDETLAYVKAKQRYTSDRSDRAQPSANTILVANIPETLLTYEKLNKVFDVFPGGARDIHISRDTRSLSSMLSTRDQIVEAIELAPCACLSTRAYIVATSAAFGLLELGSTLLARKELVRPEPVAQGCVVNRWRIVPSRIALCGVGPS
jgi:hypothetical protein